MCARDVVFCHLPFRIESGISLRVSDRAKHKAEIEICRETAKERERDKELSGSVLVLL